MLRKRLPPRAFPRVGRWELFKVRGYDTTDIFNFILNVLIWGRRLRLPPSVIKRESTR